MESYGEKLKKTREAKGLTMQKVEADTTISQQYIDALETERIEAFPGEPYFIGFLNNYCEYLGIDAKDVLALYHAKKIQETPAPIELLQKKKPKWLLPLIIIFSSLVLVVLAVYLYIFVFKIPEKQAEKRLNSVEKVKTHQYTFTGKTETKRLYKGDQILYPAVTGEGNIVITVGETVGSLKLLMPAGTQVISLSEERELDVDGDNVPDMIFYLSDVSDIEESHGAEVRMLAKREDEVFVEVADKPVADEATVSNASTVKNSGNRTVIHEDTRAYPFTINVSVRTPSLLRYKIDRQNYVEDYFKSGELVTITANNGVRLWSSNINTIKIQVIAGLQSYNLEVGKAGQVQAEDIKWVRDNDGKYRLVILELD